MTHTEALRLALDALESLQGGCTDSNDGTVEAFTVWCPEVIDACRAALAAPSVPSGGPVAWVYTGVKADGTEHGPHLVWKPAYMDARSASKGATATPLYATPQPAPAGWRLVPAEPTEAMQAVIRNEFDIYGSEWALYAAMLDAAPAAPGGAHG